MKINRKRRTFAAVLVIISIILVWWLLWRGGITSPISVETPGSHSSQRIEPGETLPITVRLFLGDDESKVHKVTLQYIVRERNTSNILQTSKEELGMRSADTILRQVTLPSDLRPGQYELSVDALHNDTLLTDIAQSLFSIERTWLGYYMSDWYRACGYGLLAWLLLLLLLFLRRRPAKTVVLFIPDQDLQTAILERFPSSITAHIANSAQEALRTAAPADNQTVYLCDCTTQGSDLGNLLELQNISARYILLVDDKTRDTVRSATTDLPNWIVLHKKQVQMRTLLRHVSRS